ncbi:MAG: hypothetical protein WCF36_03010 [Candidatus Nanopelagicales bacterium]
MINPVSALVLAPSLLVSLPALHAVWAGRMPFDVGLSRFLVVQLVCWVGLSAGARAVASWSEDAGLGDEADQAGIAGIALGDPEAAASSTALAGEA